MKSNPWYVKTSVQVRDSGTAALTVIDADFKKREVRIEPIADFTIVAVMIHGQYGKKM